MERRDTFVSFDLCVLEREEPGRVLQIWRDEADRLGSLGLASQPRRARSCTEGKDCRRSDANERECASDSCVRGSNHIHLLAAVTQSWPDLDARLTGSDGLVLPFEHEFDLVPPVILTGRPKQALRPNPERGLEALALSLEP